jgi:hypothetical protein
VLSRAPKRSHHKKETALLKLFTIHRGSCEHGSELSDSINIGEFFDELRDYQLLDKDFATVSYLVADHSGRAV